MFRNILKTNNLVVTTRNFCEKRLPTIIWSENMMSEHDDTEKQDKPKEENISWKATNGNGKSIYDCENESWCVPDDKSKKLK